MYIENSGGYRDLYDLRTDPHEMDNVVDEPRNRRQVLALARILDRLRGCVAAECEIRVPPGLETRRTLGPETAR
jgi:N-acetylglucosamine-6-sulfatase